MAHFILWNSTPEDKDWQQVIDGKSQLVPRVFRPLGPHQLATWLRNHGYTVKVVDFCNYMTVDQLTQITEKYIENSTVAIGVSTTFWPTGTRVLSVNAPKQVYDVPPWVDRARNQLENKHTNIKWCLGGARTFYYQSMPQWQCFSGDAEDSVLKWLDEITGKKIFRQPFDIKEAASHFVDDDHIQPQEVIPVELGRGCMFKCKFCSFDKLGKKPGTYLKNYHRVYQEILEHHEKWGTTRFVYVDDTVNESEEKIQALADIALSVPFKLEWVGFIRADLIWSKPNTAQLLKDSGLRSASIGIESFERKSSQLIGKGWSGKHARDWLLEKRAEWGDDVNWYLSLIVGIPGQTFNQLNEDCDWLIKNDMHSWSFLPLYIMSDHTQIEGSWMSEFTRNYSQYGFEFPDSSRPWYWKNGKWNFDVALEVSRLLNEKGFEYTKSTSFQMAETATHGFEFDEIMNLKWKDYPWERVYKSAVDFIDKYIKLSLQ